MIMGVSGHFLDGAVNLGVIKTRESSLNLVANPRMVGAAGQPVEPFSGPVAILVDSGSYSASEIFAGGMQSIGRARVFGSRTRRRCSAGRARAAARRRRAPIRHRGFHDGDRAADRRPRRHPGHGSPAHARRRCSPGPTRCSTRPSTGLLTRSVTDASSLVIRLRHSSFVLRPSSLVLVRGCLGRQSPGAAPRPLRRSRPRCRRRPKCCSAIAPRLAAMRR